MIAHRSWANQFRLFVHAAADCLLDPLRRWSLRRGVPRGELGTRQLLLLKVGGRVQRLAEHFRLHLARGHPGQLLQHVLTTRTGRP